MSSEDKKFFGVIAGSMLVSLVIISVLVANSGAYNLTPAEKNIADIGGMKAASVNIGSLPACNASAKNIGADYVD